MGIFVFTCYLFPFLKNFPNHPRVVLGHVGLKKLDDFFGGGRGISLAIGDYKEAIIVVLDTESANAVLKSFRIRKHPNSGGWI